jgi:hypothetical protein
MRGELLISERLYAALLILYPRRFRAAYGKQMRLTFRDACRVAYQRNGTIGLLAFWLLTLLDLIKSALAERVRQGEITLSKTRLIALAGPLTLLVGAMWVVASIGEVVLLVGPSYVDTFWDHFYFFPIFLSFILMLPAFILTRLRYHLAAAAPGRLGLNLSIAGCAGTWLFVLSSILIDMVAPALDDGGWPDYVISACVLAIMIGHMLFGMDALRNRLLPRWNVMPLLVGLPTTLLIVPSLIIESNIHSDFQSVLTTAFLRFAFTGAGWVLQGIALMEPRRELQPTAAI